MELDYQLFLQLNHAFSGSLATSFFTAITYLGNGLVTGALIIGLLYFLDRGKLRRHLLPLVLSTALSGAVVNIIKPIVNRPRPADFYTNTNSSIHTPSGTPTDKSFPSGHTQTAFSAAAYLSCVYPPWSPLLLGFAALTGLSRIALGVHFPSDVLVGALFGIAFAILGYRLEKSYRKRRSGGKQNN